MLRISSKPTYGDKVISFLRRNCGYVELYKELKGKKEQAMNKQNHVNTKAMEGMNRPLKSLELRIVAELMRNSRRSDRELAKVIGVSQPTIARTINRLERMGVIQEYTMIPNFHMLGYTIMGSTRFELTEPPVEDRAKSRKTLIDAEEDKPHAVPIAAKGHCEGRNQIFVNFYENYSEYVKGMKTLKAIPFINVENIDTFLIDLTDNTNYRILSMSAIATNLLNRLKEKE